MPDKKKDDASFTRTHCRCWSPIAVTRLAGPSTWTRSFRLSYTSVYLPQAMLYFRGDCVSRFVSTWCHARFRVRLGRNEGVQSSVRRKVPTMSQVLQRTTFASERPQVLTRGGGKHSSCTGRHLTLLRPIRALIGGDRSFALKRN